jgi:hypothetical protein
MQLQPGINIDDTDFPVMEANAFSLLWETAVWLLFSPTSNQKKEQKLFVFAKRPAGKPCASSVDFRGAAS